jgi:hypothetical protein
MQHLKKIDPLTMTVKEMYAELLSRAYDGNAPEGGFELEPAAAVVACNDIDGMFDVEFAPEVEAEFLSWDDRLVPENRADEPEPKASDPPFEIPFLEQIPKNAFGEALVNYAKLNTVIRAYGEPTENVEHFFKNEWGIPDEYDMSPFVCVPRSEGPKVFAGVLRKTVPTMLSMSGAQNLVKLHDRGYAGQGFGEDALIDWPRVKAYIKAVCTQVSADDESARNRLHDLHYMIRKSEVPKAPKELILPHVRFKKREPNKFNVAVLDTVLANFKRFHHVPIQFHENLTVVGHDPVIGAYPQRPVKSTVELDIFAHIIDDPYIGSIENKVVEELREKNREASINGLFNGMLQGFAMLKVEQVPRAFQLRKLIADEDWDVLQGILQRYIPDNFMERIVALFRVVYGKSVREKLQRLLSQIEIPPLYRKVPIGELKLENLLKYRKCIRYFAEGFKRVLQRIENIALRAPLFVREVYALLLHPLTFYEGISHILKSHALYWKNRYLKALDKKTPRYLVARKQFAAKHLPRMKWLLTEDGSIEHDHGSFLVQMKKYVATKYEKVKGHKIGIHVGTLHDLAVWADQNIKQEVPLEEVITWYKGEVNLFTQDVREFIARFLEDPDVEQYEKASDEDSDSVVLDPGDEKVEQDPADEKVENDDGADLLAELDYEPPPGDTDVNLAMELEDEGFDVKSDKAKMWLAAQPARVELVDFQKYRDEFFMHLSRK